MILPLDLAPNQPYISVKAEYVPGYYARVKIDNGWPIKNVYSYGQIQGGDKRAIDFGDATHFDGLIAATGDETVSLHANYLYETDPSGTTMFPVRSVLQEPWNNPNNLTRDQLMPLVAAFYKDDGMHLIRTVYYQHKARFYFCANIDRDYPGTTKKPYPHKVNGKWRLFDYRDPLMPHHILALRKASGIESSRIFTAIAILTFKAEAKLFDLTDNDDQGALMATSMILGLESEFKRLNPKWKTKLASYCLGWREQGYLYKRLVDYFEAR